MAGKKDDVTERLKKLETELKGNKPFLTKP